MDENGNQNIVYGTQCHEYNNVKIVNGSEPLSQESYTELPQMNVQNSYTQLHGNIAVSESFNFILRKRLVSYYGIRFY